MPKWKRLVVQLTLAITSAVQARTRVGGGGGGRKSGVTLVTTVMRTALGCNGALKMMV
jgi:hypothetical protein